MKKSKMSAEELQQLRLLKIERNAGIFAMVGLCAAIIVQQLTGRDGMRELIGEYCVGAVVCIYLILSCLKNGIWDNTSKSKLKYNLLIGLVVGLVSGIAMFYGSYKMHGEALNAALSGLTVAALLFCVCIAALTIAAFVYKNKAKQQAELEEAEEAEEPETLPEEKLEELPPVQPKMPEVSEMQQVSETEQQTPAQPYDGAPQQDAERQEPAAQTENTQKQNSPLA